MNFVFLKVLPDERHGTNMHTHRNTPDIFQINSFYRKSLTSFRQEAKGICLFKFPNRGGKVTPCTFFQIRNCLTPKCFPQLLIPPYKSCVFIDAYLFQFFKESYIKTSCSGFQKSFVSPSGTVQRELLNINLYPPLALSFAYFLLKKMVRETGHRYQ